MNEVVARTRGRPRKEDAPAPRIPTMWKKTAPVRLNTPVAMFSLVANPKLELLTGRVAIRNEINVHDFLKMVGCYSHALSSDGAMARHAMDQLEGWTRLDGTHPYKGGSLCVVWRRDGTDGRPTEVPREDGAPDEDELDKQRIELAKEQEAWVLDNEFVGFLTKTTVRMKDNYRGRVVMDLRKRRNGLHPNRVEGFNFIHPHTFQELVDMQDPDRREDDDLIDTLRGLWQEFKRFKETPEEKAERRRLNWERKRQTDLLRIKELQKDRQVRLRREKAREVRRMLREAEAALTQPCAHLDGKYCNQVSGKELLHQVLGHKKMDIRRCRFEISEALRALPGWTRKPWPIPHRGQTQYVFRRDGTDGKPSDTLPNAAVPARKPRRRVD